MNAPDELRDGSRAAGWLNKLLAFVKMTRLVEGVGYRLIQTTRGTALEIQPGKGGKGSSGVPSWRGEWVKYEVQVPGEPLKFRTYTEGDMVIRGGKVVDDPDALPLITDGKVAGTWIAKTDLSQGEEPGAPGAAEILNNAFNWELVARFASPEVVARKGNRKATIASNATDAAFYLGGGTNNGSVTISLNAALGKTISLRELRVCQNGVFKKMIVLGSEIFD